MFTPNFGLGSLGKRLVQLLAFFTIYVTSSIKTFACEQFSVAV